MDMFIILIVVMLSQAYTYVKIYQNVLFKYLQFILLNDISLKLLF